MFDVGVLTTYRTGHALYTLGNIQIGQAQRLLSQGEHGLGEAKMAEAYENHSQTLRAWLATLGEHHHKTGDVRHKLAWHLHRQRKYPEAM